MSTSDPIAHLTSNLPTPRSHAHQHQQPAAAGTDSKSSSSSSSSQQRSPPQKNAGTLHAAILSAYDLKKREPPAYVSLTINKESVHTGPPAQRHKDRNSFKFATSAKQQQQHGSSNGGSSTNKRPNQVTIQNMSLAEMYQSTLQVKVVYPNDTHQNLTAEYDLNQLKIGETTWLILTLEGTNANTNTNNNNNNKQLVASSNDSATIDDTDTFTEVAPTLRLHLTLLGPYRPEIQAIVNVFKKWCNIVDSMDDSLHAGLNKLPTNGITSRLNSKYLLIPAVPVATLGVMTLPVIAGITLIGLPILWPLVVFGGITGAVLIVLALFFYASSRPGRTFVQNVFFAPVFHTLASTSTGQKFLYPTGPRPTPVQMIRTVTPDNIWTRLFISLTIDLIGSSSYLVPLVGEVFDLVWAPLQTMLIMAMYDDVAPNLKYLSFLEEICIFTDFVPSATLGWMTQFGLPIIFPNSNSKNNKKSNKNSTSLSVAANRSGHKNSYAPENTPHVPSPK